MEFNFWLVLGRFVQKENKTRANSWRNLDD